MGPTAIALVSHSRALAKTVRTFCEERKLTFVHAEQPSQEKGDDLLLIDTDSVSEEKRPTHTDWVALIPFEKAARLSPLLRERGVTCLLSPISTEDLSQLLATCRSEPPRAYPELSTVSRSMQQLVSQAMRVAATQASVLISGESGTGKEVLAQLIHHHSRRAQAPFIKVNCAAIPDSLIESEFFGHEKGAFTGAYSARKGRFELAHRGTILLDEVSETPLALQAKLLRAIQEQEFERVGGSATVHVDVRVLATSNRNMEEAIAHKLFREDLYFRLNVIPLHIPPLRERREDILPLAHHFLNQGCARNGLPQKELTPCAEERLVSHSWPGNVRELANSIERSLILCSGDCLDGRQLQLGPSSRTQPTLGYLPGKTLAELEREWILAALQTHQSHRKKTAAELGISIRTLRNKLRSYRKEVQVTLF